VPPTVFVVFGGKSKRAASLISVNALHCSGLNANTVCDQHSYRVTVVLLLVVIIISCMQLVSVGIENVFAEPPHSSTVEILTADP
jgi:hypothetical protein